MFQFVSGKHETSFGPKMDHTHTPSPCSPKLDAERSRFASPEIAPQNTEVMPVHTFFSYDHIACAMRGVIPSEPATPPSW